MKFYLEGAGGADGKTSEIDIPAPYDFILHVGDKPYRFSFDKDGSIKVALINGVDARIDHVGYYPAVKLIHN